MLGWDWSVFFKDLFHPVVLHGLWTTIWLTLTTLSLAITLGTTVAFIGRINNIVARTFYRVYVDIFRSVPQLVQLVFLYSALPQLGISLTVVQAAIIGLMVAESPYVAEIVRSSLSAVPDTQWEASRAIGMRPRTILRVVVFPQAFRIALPPLGNEFVHQLKSTSLVSVISMTELFRSTNNLSVHDFRVLEALTVAAIYYLLVTVVWMRFQHLIERRNSRWLADASTSL